MESGSQKILNEYKKDITITQIRRVFKLCHEIGLPAFAGWMIHPDYTRKDVLHDLLFAFKINAELITLSQLIPFPGTEIYEKLKNSKKLLTQDWDLYDGARALIKGKLSASERRFWQIVFMFMFHLSPFAAIQRREIFVNFWKTLLKMFLRRS